jgi:two-component system sensor kinase FixL
MPNQPQQVATPLYQRGHDLLSALLEVAGVLISVIDNDGRIILFNRACERLTGWSFEEIKDRFIWDVVLIPEETAAVKQVFYDLVAGRFPNEHENYWKTRDGGRRWIHWKNTALTAHDGTVQYIIATGIDITERKQIEEALQESHQFSQAILDTTVDGIICIDADGRIAVFNQAAERIFGYTAAEVLGKKINLLMSQRDNDEHDHYMRRYLETGQNRIIGKGREVTGLRKNQTTFPMELSVGRVPLPGRSMFAGVVRDITDRKLAEQEAKRRLDELAQVSRMSLMGEMASGLAHEINQPLAAITNYAHACQRLLQSGRGDTQLLLNTLEQIAKQGQRAGEIVSHLRQFIDRGRTEHCVTNINAIVSGVVDLLRHEMEAHKVSLHLDTDDGLPNVVVDKVQIEQVILNLVKNAIDAMKDVTWERLLSIVIKRQDRPQQAIEVDVSDSGEGLPAGSAHRIFDPLFTTKPNGIGVGLSISRSIIRTHGGRLWAEPKAGNGACFRFTLPITDNNDGAGTN